MVSQRLLPSPGPSDKYTEVVALSSSHASLPLPLRDNWQWVMGAVIKTISDSRQPYRDDRKHKPLMLFGILRDRQMAGRPPFERLPTCCFFGSGCRWLSASRFENPIYQIRPARQSMHCRPYVALTSASPRHFDQQARTRVHRLSKGDERRQRDL